MENYSKEQIEKNLKRVLTLEYYGIKIEEISTIKDEFSIDSINVYWFSVPEKSLIDNLEKCTTQDLIGVAKREIREMFIDTVKNLDLNFADEFLKEESINEYLKFYAKIRTGETWTKEMGEQRIKELNYELKELSGWKEV